MTLLIQQWTAAVVMGGVKVLFLLAQPFDEKMLRKSFEQSPRGNVEFTVDITPGRYSTFSVRQEFKLDWSIFTRAVIFSDGILLDQGPSSLNWGPFYSLVDPTRKEELIALVTESVMGTRRAK